MTISKQACVTPWSDRRQMPDTPDTTVTLRYFAWVREKTGVAEESIVLPADISTVGELLQWLSSRGPQFEDAFSRGHVIRAALDRVHVKPDAKIGMAREIAFFPPVTGG